LQAVILAGGAGKRVFPLAVYKPKPMFKLLGKPLLQHVIEILKANGLDNFVVVTGHNGDQINDYFGDGKKFGAKIRYTLQKDPLGMANALETARELVEDNFFVVNADDLFEGSLITQMIHKFKAAKADIVLSCKRVEETWKFGIVKVDKDKVTKLVEKPPRGQEESNLAVIGVYLMTKRIFGYLEKTPVSDHQYEDAIQSFIEDRNNVRAVSYEGFFAGYKYPWDLFRMNQFLMDAQIQEKRIEEDVYVSESAKIEGNVLIKNGVKILDNACVKGPCYIGENTVIGNNCLIRGYSSIGDNCIVGFTTEVKSSLIGDNCLFHMNYLGDSIISDDCLFGAGATTANFRFDEKNVSVVVDGKKVDSATNKLGAIVGDNSKVGINSSIAPGVKIGPFSIVGAGVHLQEDLEPGKMLFLDRKSNAKKENTVTLSPEENRKLMILLKKYK
jgi:UDP-N-acetylglucosamine diphosphorylase / glucose-1-phosphate thymidylyltransferase / UDP-N-acetylgalactosamine diphosphorylase / glucosamine-1-phosphate N-acetyltransferase / galactosamine-1-phosphate N-acetyltransferase